MEIIRQVHEFAGIETPFVGPELFSLRVRQFEESVVDGELRLQNFMRAVRDHPDVIPLPTVAVAPALDGHARYTAARLDGGVGGGVGRGGGCSGTGST